MKELKCIIIFMFFSAFIFNVHAQEWTEEQQEIWKVIDNAWKLEKDTKSQIWPKVMHPDGIGWNNETPMPRNKEMMTRWSNFYNERNILLEYQLHPMAIIIKNNIAIVHYYYFTVSQLKDGKTETVKGRWTDIWIKEGTEWLALAWQGGKDK
ncbi:MAG: DUF4440 domain-containing protein [Melioribacteraceae bacterium]|nr:DUF4440 domain-containing protein [Melioribacteraceae bacterium]